ncbi:glycogen/starch/alpha-glucan phosphorylase, partial [Mycobacterium tuberculosis]|nr:glycogen/starch/alpha-glucan phosphorylase [Mycobacterium tuberculosis]
NDPIQLDRFNSGDHLGALTNTAAAETITQVLYPSDATPAGQELRLRQEYFFTSASLQDICRRHKQQYGSLANLAVERLDLVQLHCPPTDVYYRPEVFAVLDGLKAAGKIRDYGVSV